MWYHMTIWILLLFSLLGEDATSLQLFDAANRLEIMDQIGYGFSS